MINKWIQKIKLFHNYRTITFILIKSSHRMDSLIKFPSQPPPHWLVSIVMRHRRKNSSILLLLLCRNWSFSLRSKMSGAWKLITGYSGHQFIRFRRRIHFSSTSKIYSMVFSVRQTNQQIRHYTIENFPISVRSCRMLDTTLQNYPSDASKVKQTSSRCSYMATHTLNGRQNVAKETWEEKYETFGNGDVMWTEHDGWMCIWRKKKSEKRINL